jgi:hypothetical protein
MNKKLNYAWLLSLLMIFSITFVSCSKDDDDEVNKDELIGTWKSEKVEGSYQGVKVELPMEVTYEFNKDGSYTEKSIEGTEKGTWELSGNKLKLTSDGETTTLTAEISGKTLTLSGEMEEEGEKVKVTMTLKKQ